jgi:hypothetical protein
MTVKRGSIPGGNTLLALLNHSGGGCRLRAGAPAWPWRLSWNPPGLAMMMDAARAEQQGQRQTCLLNSDQSLKAAQPAAQMLFQVVVSFDEGAADAVVFDVIPNVLVRIQFRRVRRQVEEPQLSLRRGRVSTNGPRFVNRMAVHNQEDRSGVHILSRMWIAGRRLRGISDSHPSAPGLASGFRFYSARFGYIAPDERLMNVLWL